jgi:hypothetical protein
MSSRSAFSGRQLGAPVPDEVTEHPEPELSGRQGQGDQNDGDDYADDRDDRGGDGGQDLLRDAGQASRLTRL